MELFCWNMITVIEMEKWKKQTIEGLILSAMGAGLVCASSVCVSIIVSLG